MSRDIRSFFAPKKSKSFSTLPASNDEKKKVKQLVISDDEDDFVPESPAMNKNAKTSKRRILDDSDEEVSIKKSKSDTSKSTANGNFKDKKKPKDNKKAEKLKEVNASDLFSSAPIKRIKIQDDKQNINNSKDKNCDNVNEELSPKKSTPKTELDSHDDDDFKKTLIQIDEEEVSKKVSNAKIPKTLGKTKSPNKRSHKTDSSIMKLETHNVKRSKSLHKPVEGETKRESPQKTSSRMQDAETSEKKIVEQSATLKERVNGDTFPKKTLGATKLENAKKKRDFSDFISDSNTDWSCDTVHKDFSDHETRYASCSDSSHQQKKRLKLETDDSLNESVLTDEDRFERKRHSAILYQKYLNRSGPKHHGSKEIPEGCKDCLSGLVFVVTGILDSLDRDEAVEIITKYGGKVNSGVTGKVTHILFGDEAGPAKIAKAEKLNIPLLTEDNFLDLIRERSYATSAEAKVDQKVDKKLKPTFDSIDKSKQKKEKVSPKKPTDNAKKIDKSNKEILCNDIVNAAQGGIKSPDKSKFSKLLKIPSKHDEDATKSEKARVNAGVDVDKIAAGSSKSSSKFFNESAMEVTAKVPGSGLSVPRPVQDVGSLAWVDKYKPQNVKQIIGQRGDASNVNKLTNWLTKWYYNRTLKIPKPSPWAKSDDGGYYKAALLSGPPGVGKTTTVSLVCKELGFDVFEFNASDTRNKTLIKEQLSRLLPTNQLAGFAQGKTGRSSELTKNIIVMDEVDGMGGNEDRGGMQELIGLIKTSALPIVCMCNDRDSPKMRSLVNYCFDIRFQRPRVEQIKAAVMSICYKEGVKMTPDAAAQLIATANQDIRQTLNLLAMWSVADKNISMDSVNKDSKTSRRDKRLGPWDAVRKAFSAEEHKSMSIHDKSDLFFHDYSISPLFVQENYLIASPHCPKGEILKRIAVAADSISCGDLVDSAIRGRSAWSLLPVQAMYSSVIPGTVLSGHFTGQIQFPGWLGKNSRRNKLQRISQELHTHTRLSTSGSKQAIILDYAPHLRDAIVKPLVRDKSEGVQQALAALQAYHLMREDLDGLTELSMWPGQRDPMLMVDSKVKAAMTRTYNKEAEPLPYAPPTIKKVKSTVSSDDVKLTEDDEEELGEENDDSDPESDALIKKSKSKAASKGSKEVPGAAPSAKNKSKDGKGKQSKK